MVGRHDPLIGHESEPAPGDSDGQGSRGAAVHGVTKSQTQQTQQSDTTLKNNINNNKNSVVLSS